MQSPMTVINANLIPSNLTVPSAVRGGYSELRVLMSAAGYYLGTLYEEFDHKGTLVWQEPGSRDSIYFGTEEQAELALRQFKGGDLTDARFEP